MKQMVPFLLNHFSLAEEHLRGANTAQQVFLRTYLF